MFVLATRGDRLFCGPVWTYYTATSARFPLLLSRYACRVKHLLPQHCFQPETFYILREVCPAGQRHNPRDALHTHLISKCSRFSVPQLADRCVNYTSCWLTSVFRDSLSLINPYKMSLNSFQSRVSAIIWRIHIIFDRYAVTGCSLMKSSNLLTPWTCVASVR